ncbi:hypothetical protein J5N97_017972 [Dioscorea zingiberensis]|uniref:Uncharacterized protein n=1 Tax=Dioscorea zingiberensis TaxID=325984 RepID=A0A9D5HH74_9LILI|nr:hypothetical protein J5N97_017972 [Dioscorea zingiberensis]
METDSSVAAVIALEIYVCAQPNSCGSLPRGSREQRETQTKNGEASAGWVESESERACCEEGERFRVPRERVID